MQNNSLFKLWLAIALTAALFAAVMVVSAFAVDVDNETDFLTALTTAPADEETVIKITGDFVIEAKDSFTPPEGAIIVITSDEPHSITYDRASNGYAFLKITNPNTTVTLKGQVKLTTTHNHCAVSLSGAGSVFNLEEEASIDGFGLTTDNSGGCGVRCFTDTTFNMNGGSIVNCTVTGASSSGNRARGCAIYIGGGTVVLNDGLIAGNSITTAANYNGGAAVYLNSAASSFTMNGGVIAGNVVTSSSTGASCGGGAIFCNNSASVTINGGRIGGTELADGTPDPTGAKGNCIVSPSGMGSVYGSVMYGVSGTVTLNGGTFSYNNAIRNGSNEAAGTIRNGATMYIRETDPVNDPLIFENNKCGYYAGVIYHSSNTPLEIEGGTFRGNTSSGTGAVAWSSGDLTISGGTFENNTSGSSGGVVNMSGNAKTLTVTGGTFTGNTGTTGACFSGNSIVNISGGTFTGNKATSSGGVLAVLSGSTATVTGGTFDGNTAGSGCGLYVANGGSLAISGNIDGAGVDNFLYLAAGASAAKGGNFEWTGKMGIKFAAAAVDGDMAIKGGEMITEDDLNFFTTDPKAFQGYIASLTYVQDGVIALSLTDDPDAVPVVINKTTSTPYFSLVTAISEAADGDVIELQDNVNLAEQITITRGITLTAKEGADITITKTAGGAGNGIFFCNTPSGSTGVYVFDGGLTLDAGGNFTRAITTNTSRDTLVLNNVKITGGTTYGVLPYGPVEINEGAEIYGNGSGGSAAVYASAVGAPVTMTGGKIHDNNSRGMYVYGGASLTMTGGEIYNNTVTQASTSGGAIFSGYSNGAGAVLNISNAKLYGNTATGNGGAFYSQASVTLDNVEITGNTGSYGGAMYLGTASSVINITNCKINGNTAVNEAGGFACGNVTSVDITDTEICGNTASSVGGAVEFYGACEANVTFTRVKIAGNTASGGGAIYKGKSSTLTLNDCTFGGTEIGTDEPDVTGTRGNYARHGGAGALYSAGGVTVINGGSFTGNVATGVGGAINCANATEMTLNGVDVIDNHAVGGVEGVSSYAGALNIGSTTVLTLNDCVFKANTSSGGGGAMILNGTAYINDTVIAGNACGTKIIDGVPKATSTGYGGSGIYVDNAGQVEFNNATVTGNGNGYAAVYASRGDSAANSVTFDGKVIIKDNSPSIDNYNAGTGVYEVGEEETARGLYWAFGQAEKTSVSFKDTLDADTDVIITLSSDAIGPEDVVFVGKSVNDVGAYSTTDISAVLAKFATLGGVTLTQSGSDVSFKNEGTITFTVISANNGESRVYNPVNIGGEFKLPDQSTIIEDMTDPAVFDAYADRYFVGYAEVENFGTNPTLKALYEEDNTTLTADELNGKTLYAVWAFMKTVPGASVKVSGEEGGISGIRFVTLLETDTLAKIGIKDLTEEEWAAGDIGYRFGFRITKDYGESGAAYQDFVGKGGKTFSDEWFGDLLYDANYDDRGTNHAFSLGLSLIRAQYEFLFTPRAFIQLQYTKGYNETHFADYPTELIDEEPVTLKRSARQVAQGYAAFLTSDENEHKSEEYLGFTELQMQNFERLAGLTFDKANKSFS